MHYTITYRGPRGNVRTLTRKWTTLFPLETLLAEWTRYYTNTTQITGHVVLHGTLLDNNGETVQSFDWTTNPQSNITPNHKPYCNHKLWAQALTVLQRERERLAGKRVSSLTAV